MYSTVGWTCCSVRCTYKTSLHETSLSQNVPLSKRPITKRPTHQRSHSSKPPITKRLSSQNVPRHDTACPGSRLGMSSCSSNRTAANVSLSTFQKLQIGDWQMETRRRLTLTHTVELTFGGGSLRMCCFRTMRSKLKDIYIFLEFGVTCPSKPFPLIPYHLMRRSLEFILKIKLMPPSENSAVSDSAAWLTSLKQSPQCHWKKKGVTWINFLLLIFLHTDKKRILINFKPVCKILI